MEARGLSNIHTGTHCLTEIWTKWFQLHSIYLLFFFCLLVFLLLVCYLLCRLRHKVEKAELGSETSSETDSMWYANSIVPSNSFLSTETLSFVRISDYPWSSLAILGWTLMWFTSGHAGLSSPYFSNWLAVQSFLGSVLHSVTLGLSYTLLVTSFSRGGTSLQGKDLPQVT